MNKEFKDQIEVVKQSFESSRDYDLKKIREEERSRAEQILLESKLQIKKKSVENEDLKREMLLLKQKMRRYFKMNKKLVEKFLKEDFNSMISDDVSD